MAQTGLITHNLWVIFSVLHLQSQGLAAFMLESTFVGLFYFGWDKVSKKQHLCATFCMAIGSSFSALLILVANGYMQHPVGSEFVASTMRMETVSLLDVFIIPHEILTIIFRI